MDLGLVSGIAAGVGSLFGTGGLVDQLFYTRDEKAQNQIAYTQALSQAQAAQAAQTSANKPMVDESTIKLVLYIFAGLITIVLLVFLFKYIMSRKSG